LSTGARGAGDARSSAVALLDTRLQLRAVARDEAARRSHAARTPLARRAAAYHAPPGNASVLRHMLEHTRPCPSCGAPINLVEHRLRVPYVDPSAPGELKERDEFHCRACQRSSTIHPDFVAIGVLLLVLGGLLAAVLGGFNRSAAIAIALAVVVVGSRWLRKLRPAA
jgi:hypothetical protein